MSTFLHVRRQTLSAKDAVHTTKEKKNWQNPRTYEIDVMRSKQKKSGCVAILLESLTSLNDDKDK